MPKTITAIIENNDEVWDCAYESIEQARKDVMDYLEDLRGRDKGRWSSISYVETTTLHGRRGLFSLSQYGTTVAKTIELKPLVLG